MTDWNCRLPYLFHDISRYRTMIFDRFMRPHDLTSAQWQVLAQLFRRDGMTQVEVCDRTDLGAVTVSGLIDRLEAKGWVERRSDASDRRVKRIWLTPKADEIHEVMTEHVGMLNDACLKGLSEAERERLCAQLSLIKRNLRDVLEQSNDAPGIEPAVADLQADESMPVRRAAGT
jgi:DNA-binding MarR family transcriptional regulator